MASCLKSKIIKLFFVYLPVFLILCLIAIVYCAYIFTYITFLINPVEQPNIYPFSHTATPESGKRRGIILLSIVTFFFFLTFTSMLRVIFMDPGYVPSPLELEYKIIQKNINPKVEKNRAFRQNYKNFNNQIKEGPLTSTEKNKIIKSLDFKNPVPPIDEESISLLVKENDPFNKYINMDFSKVLLCGSCLRWKVERAHHCRQCGKCVLKMDHHCPWLGTCIGFRNYKYFLLLQLHGLISTTIVFFTLIEALINHNMNENTNLLTLILLLFGWVCDGGLFAFLLWLFCINWRLMFRGETVIENSDKQRFPSNNTPNIYDLGPYKNFTSVFGTNPLIWFLPILPNYKGEGVVYEINDSFDVEKIRENPFSGI